MEEPKRSKSKQKGSGSVPMSPGDQAKPGTPGTGEVICRECHGSGKVGDASCRHCGGTGRVVEGIGGA
jgi:DnaJ-class molecular chaperone